MSSIELVESELDYRKGLTSMLSRRDVLNLGVSAAAAAPFVSTRAVSPADESVSFRIIDTNVSLFHWPFRRLPLDDVEQIVKKLRSLGIDQAWAGSFEGILHRDIADVNRRLVEACQRHPELIAIGSVNPELPNWQVDLQRCIEEYRMPAVRLHPNYHGYKLDNIRFEELLDRVTKAGRFVQLVGSLEDTRTQHPMMRVPDVDLSLLPEVMSRVMGARVQILNWRPTGPLLETLAKIPGMYFDTARVEGTDGVPSLVSRLSSGQVMFGSHASFLIPESALIRVHESGKLNDVSLRQVLSENAELLLRHAKS